MEYYKIAGQAATNVAEGVRKHWYDLFGMVDQVSKEGQKLFLKV